MILKDLLKCQKYVISLPHRKDRRESFILSAARANLKNYRWFVGIDGIEVPYKGVLTPGQLGCKLSHIEVIKQAKYWNLPEVMIIEDDAIFDLSEYSLGIEIPDDWDVLYLGANNYKSLQMIGPHIGKCIYSLSTPGYIIKNTCYDLILDLLKEDQILDVIYAKKLQKIVNCYCITPSLVRQAKGFSDVERRVVNYDRYYK